MRLHSRGSREATAHRGVSWIVSEVPRVSINRVNLSLDVGCLSLHAAYDGQVLVVAYRQDLTTERDDPTAQTGTEHMTAPESSGATTGYEAKLWEMADALRGSMDAALYKHVVLGLIFLKYVSDAFEETRVGLKAEIEDGADPEDPDEYRALNIFWVPKEARWSHLQAQARQPIIGQTVDDAMAAIERDNKALKGVLPKDYARPALDKRRLGDLIDLVGNIKVGDAESRSKDVLGRVYEYFLSRFADAEGKRGGEFYTPR